MSQQVLHLDFISLNPDTSPAQRNQLEAAAAELNVLEGVEGIGVIEAGAGSDFDVVFWFVLRDYAALEPFGTDPRYSRFLQGSVAPLLRSFAGADVKLEDGFGSSDGPAACLALAGPEETYDFEVRDALVAWADGLAADCALSGVAVGERQLYRGAAIAFGGDAGKAERPEIAPFRVTLIRGAARGLA